MSAQIRVSKVGVPSEKSTGISLDVVSSKDPATPSNPKLDVTSTTAMRSNNMPARLRP